MPLTATPFESVHSTRILFFSPGFDSASTSSSYLFSCTATDSSATIQFNAAIFALRSSLTAVHPFSSLRRPGLELADAEHSRTDPRTIWGYMPDRYS
ncbi:hypothetical protein SERLADRAFT_479832, partial [Serpula lacrymans var. lacrymans S7.9]